MSPPAVDTFNRYFEPWGVHLPAPAADRRKDGTLSGHGWSVRWRWCDPPGSLEFYARHRMTNERWAIVAPDGTLTYKELWDDIGFSDSAANAARDAAVKDSDMAPRGLTEAEQSTFGESWDDPGIMRWACDREPWQRSPLRTPESDAPLPATVPADISDKHSAPFLPLLGEGEELAAVERVQLVAGTKGLALPGARIGNRLARAGATHGGVGSTASTIPVRNGVLLLAITNRRALLRTFAPGGEGVALWEVPAAVMTQVERRPRLQVMARFRVHFDDGSSAAFMTFHRAAIDRLARALER